MAGLYVHIPFCHAKCAYCDFYSIASQAARKDFVTALLGEYDERRQELGNEPVKTLYFGGGTPSILSEEEFSELAEALYAHDIEEFTIEANPEDVTPEKAALWVAKGVNRVSMGVQSLVDAELRTINRRHSAEEALDAIKILRKAGITNLSCDLIYGLPGQTLDSWKYSLYKLLNAGIEHLSAYNLTIEQGTLLALRLKRGLISEADDELVERMYNYLCSAASKAGFEHYEISNFARPGYQSRHNSSYWVGTPYLGLGPGAHSLDINGIRRFVEPNLKEYIRNTASALRIDPEDEIDRINDAIFTALRTSKGLAIEKIPSRSKKAVEKFKHENLLVEKDGFISIPEEHFLISDSIIREIML